MLVAADRARHAIDLVGVRRAGRPRPWPGPAPRAARRRVERRAGHRVIPRRRRSRHSTLRESVVKFSSLRFRFAAVAGAVALLALTGAACGDNAKVGSGVNTNVKSAIQGQRLGETTTSAAPAVTAPKQVGIGSPTTTAKPVATTITTRPAAQVTTTAPKAQVFQVGINSDKSGKTQFDPQQVSVYVGTPIQFVNNDTVARSVKSGEGAAEQFQSPDIPAGGSWTYTPKTPGTIPIVDGTRPYATGTLYVAAK